MYSEDWMIGTPSPGQPCIAVIHNNSAVGNVIASAAYEHGFFPFAFTAGDRFIKAWNASRFPEPLVAWIIHKDLADGGGIGSAKLVNEIRKTPEGAALRTVLASGEFLYDPRVRSESVSVIRADAGYDPTGFDGYFPNWVGDFIGTGPVSQTEGAYYRGKSLVRDAQGAYERKLMAEFFLGKEGMGPGIEQK